MGCSLIGKSCWALSGSYNKVPNPDPLNFRIIEWEEINNYLILIVEYPDCTNFEGVKILLFKDVKYSEIKNLRELDPHFRPDRLSPIARFKPTLEGRDMVYNLIKKENK